MADNIVSSYINKIPPPIDYKKILGNELWEEYLAKKAEMIALLKEDQKFCDYLNSIITTKIEAENK